MVLIIEWFDNELNSDTFSGIGEESHLKPISVSSNEFKIFPLYLKVGEIINAEGKKTVKGTYSVRMQPLFKSEGSLNYKEYGPELTLNVRVQ